MAPSRSPNVTSQVACEASGNIVYTEDEDEDDVIVTVGLHHLVVVKRGNTVAVLRRDVAVVGEGQEQLAGGGDVEHEGALLVAQLDVEQALEAVDELGAAADVLGDGAAQSERANVTREKPSTNTNRYAAPRAR